MQTEPVLSRVGDAERLCTVEQLHALRAEWESLFARSNATAFQSAAWLIPWYDVWGKDRIDGVAVRDARGALIALLPAARMEGRIELGGSGVSDYLSALVDPRHVDAARAALSRATASWDCAFHDVPPDACWPSAGSDGWDAAPASTCPIVRLPASVDAFREQLPSGLKRNLRRYGERLFAEHDARFATIVDRHELPGVVDALFALHGMRWQARGCAGVFADDDVRTFHRAVIPALFDEGLLRLHVLRVGGRVAGAQYVLVHRGRALSYIGGFDPALNRYSPGSLLMAYSIEQAIRERCAVFDLLRGTEAYKYTWGAVDEVALSYFHGGSRA
jgi:CelD/BcsL family acetyltransferase involved in cellulose biosynthesis